MINQVNFWATWPIPYKRLLAVLSTVFVLAFIALWLSFYQSPAPVIPTQQYQQIETQEIALHSFSFAGITLTTTGDNFLLFEYQKGDYFTSNKVAAYVFLASLALAMIVLLGLITTLSRFWYFVGMGLFTLFIVGFRLEATYLFGLTNKLPTAVIIVLYGGASYYFQFFNRVVTFQVRVLFFLALTTLIALNLHFFSDTKEPFVLLAANGIVAGILLSIIFIFMVAHEILAFFITIITQGVKQTKSLQHFSIVSAIYLINLSLTYADRKGYISWNILSVNPFLLLSISALLGIWGFRQRERLYATILSANPFGTYLLLSLALICFSTVYFILGTANDPPLQLIQDTILYSHLGYGVIFICYVLANFTSMLATNQQVYKVLYNPIAMPYFTFRLGGLIATFAFFAYSTYSISVNQLFAGYYNASADAYAANIDMPVAKSYYEQALLYTNRNHHAHYALASMEALQLELKKEKNHYERTADTRPTELSYLNLSESYHREGEELLANNVLIKGLGDFPNSGKLLNALGLSYAALNIQDSALLTLAKAKESYAEQSIAETNLIGVMAKFKMTFPADSLSKLVGTVQKGAKTNALALANQQKISIAMELPPAKDTVLSIYEASLLNNYLINNQEKIDTSLLKSIIGLVRKPTNRYFKASLLEAVASACYANEDVSKAFNYLGENAFIDKNGKMYNTLGLWALEQGNAEIALTQFKSALDQKFEAANFGKALALSALKMETQAVEMWTELSKSKDTTFHKIADSFLRLYATSAADVNLLSDLQKYQFTIFKIALTDSIQFHEIVRSIKDTNVKARAILERSKKLFKQDEPQTAANLFATLYELKLNDKALYNQIVEFNLELLAAARDLQSLQKQLAALPKEAISKVNQVYFEALIDHRDGNGKSAKEKFTWLTHANPFNEEATVAAVNFIKATASDKLKAFNLLVAATSLNPGSIKLLKAYIIEAAKLGFDTYAEDSLDKLKELVGPLAYNKFIKANPEVFQILPN